MDGLFYRWWPHRPTTPPDAAAWRPERVDEPERELGIGD